MCAILQRCGRVQRVVEESRAADRPCVADSRGTRVIHLHSATRVRSDVFSRTGRFGLQNSLLILKIYSTRYEHYRFSALTVKMQD